MKRGQFNKGNFGIDELRIKDSLTVADLNTTRSANLVGAFLESPSLTGTTTVASVNIEGDVVLTNTVWDDLVVPLTQTRVGANSKPDFDFTDIGFQFPNNDATEILYFIVQLPHRYKEGTALYPHVHWRQAADQTPVFKLDYKWFNVGAAIPADFSTYEMSTKAITYTSGSIQQISKNATGITGTGKTISSILICKLYRQDSAYTGDCLAYQFDIHYEADSLGSDLEYEK
jgi:hypothetical protein